MSSTRSSESALRSSWKEASIVTCSGSHPRRSTTMFLKSSKLSFWVSKSRLQCESHRGCFGDLLYQSRRGRGPDSRGPDPAWLTLCGRLGPSRRHPQLGHDLDGQLAAGRRYLTHRGLQWPCVSPGEHAFDHPGIALDDYLLGLDSRIGKG